MSPLHSMSNFTPRVIFSTLKSDDVTLMLPNASVTAHHSTVNLDFDVILPGVP